MIWLLSLALAGLLSLGAHLALARTEGSGVSPVAVALVAGLVLAAGGVAALDAPGRSPPTAAPASSAPSASVSTPTPRTDTDVAAETATLVAVYDGNTVVVRTAEGRLETYPLAGIHAPEPTPATTDPAAFEGVLTGPRGQTCLADFGRRATDALRTTALGRPVTLSTVEDGPRTRAYLRYGGTSLNRMLVSRGYARADGDFASVERRARGDGEGLWSCGTVTFRPADPSGVAITRVHPNPVGSDEAALNGEYFVLENVGTVTVDLENWYVLVDGRNHLFFGPRELLPGQSVTVHMGRGRDSPTDRYLHANAPVLDNDHGTIVLRDGDNVRNVTATY